MNKQYMPLREVLNRVRGSNTCLQGVHTGIKLMKEHYGWVDNDWLVDHDDIGSDYRLLCTTLECTIEVYHV